MSHSSAGTLRLPCPVLQLYQHTQASNCAVGENKSGRMLGRGGAPGHDRCAWVPDRCMGPLGRAPDCQLGGTDVRPRLATVLQRERVRRRGGAVSILHRPTARCCNGACCSSVVNSASGVCWLFVRVVLCGCLAWGDAASCCVACGVRALLALPASAASIFSLAGC
jgi:hypothetical protein